MKTPKVPVDSQDIILYIYAKIRLSPEISFLSYFCFYLKTPENRIRPLFIFAVTYTKKISSSSVAQYRRKMRCYLVKFQSCLLGQLCNFEFLQVIIAFFSKSVRPRNMKFGLQRVSIWVNIQKKFQVPRSHSIGEKCDANFKLSSHFSRKVCDRGT